MLRLPAILLLLLFQCLPLAVFAQEYSHGDPTDEEQLMLELINRARSDPKAEGIRLMDTDDGSVQQAYTYWQIDKQKTKTAFGTYPVRPPLAFHPALIASSRLHTADMVANNFQGHVGSNGSQLGQRLAAQGYTSQGQYGENVSAYSNSVWYAHCGLNVDWGPQNQIDLGHRSNIMNFDGAVYTECGIGITRTNGGLQQGTVGPVVVTQNFGMRSQRYITGVVYDDKNGNGFYDVGEGIGGVKIQPSRGSYWAVTSSSGGYAIPFTGNGDVAVTASGGALTSPITINTSFEGVNVKVDFIPAAQVPGSITLLSPANNATNVNRASVQLQWQSASFAESYDIQIATTSTMAPGSIVREFSNGSTSTTVTDLLCGTTYYWRVRGTNSIGSGSWSAPFSFTTAGTNPGQPGIVGPRGNATFDNNGVVLCTWSAPPSVQRYHIRFSLNTGFSTVFAEDSSLSEPQFSLPTSTLPDGITMFVWQVRAGNECGWGAWSNNAVVTPTITSVHDDSRRSGIGVHMPSPATLMSSFVVPESFGSEVVMQVYSIAGQRISEIQSSGGQVVRLSDLGLQNRVSGMYLLVLSNNHGNVITAPFQFIHR